MNCEHIEPEHGLGGVELGLAMMPALHLFLAWQCHEDRGIMAGREYIGCGTCVLGTGPGLGLSNHGTPYTAHFLNWLSYFLRNL